MKLKCVFGKLLYHTIAIHLPMSFSKFSLGSRKIRQLCAHLILENCGEWVNIEKGARFGDNLKIGNGSGIGANSNIPGDVTIGENVMMGQDCLMFTQNHLFSDLSIPMRFQGMEKPRSIVIGNDVWIGSRVVILPGVHIGDGSVIGAGSVVTKDIPPFEVWGGNPAHFLKSRIQPNARITK